MLWLQFFLLKTFFSYKCPLNIPACNKHLIIRYCHFLRVRVVLCLTRPSSPPATSQLMAGNTCTTANLSKVASLSICIWFVGWLVGCWDVSVYLWMDGCMVVCWFIYIRLWRFRTHHCIKVFLGVFFRTSISCCYVFIFTFEFEKNKSYYEFVFYFKR